MRKHYQYLAATIAALLTATAFAADFYLTLDPGGSRAPGHCGIKKAQAPGRETKREATPERVVIEEKRLGLFS